jgi:hypothetical protein
MTKIIPLLMKRNKTLTVSISLISSLLAIGLSSTWQLAQAGQTGNAPATLTNLLTQIDNAANQGNVNGVMNLISTAK